MRHKRDGYGTQLWLSANDTRTWASRPGAAWPCSTLAGKRVWVYYDGSGDLIDITVNGNGGRAVGDVDGAELDAITSDFLREQYGPDHPAIRGVAHG